MLPKDGGLENITDFISNLPKQRKWLNSGEAIGAGAKMYGMRVDNTHSSAYNMMNRLRQNSKEEDFIEIPEGDLNDAYQLLAGPRIGAQLAFKKILGLNQQLVPLTMITMKFVTQEILMNKRIKRKQKRNNELRFFLVTMVTRLQKRKLTSH